MALKLGTLFYDITANTDGLKKGQQEVQDEVKKTSKSFSSLGKAIGAVISIEAARRVVLFADSFRILDTRLRNLSKSTAEYEKNSKALLQTASDTGQTFADTVVFFERAQRALEDLGASGSQVLEFTDTIQKLGVLGGSSVEEIANGTRQLNQALAGGIVRAEEFNSIVENTPKIANAIADSLGKSTGELRQMVLEGQLTSDKVFNAILSQSGKVNNEFEKFPRSISQAANALTNELGAALTRLGGQLGEGGGIVDFIDSITEGIRELSVAAAGSELEQLDQRIRSTESVLEGLKKQLEETKKSGDSWFASLIGVDTSGLETKIADLEAKLRGLRKEQEALETQDGGTVTTTIKTAEIGGYQDSLDLRAQILGDHLATVETKYQEHYDKLRENTLLTAQERADLELEIERKKAEEIQAINARTAAQQAQAYSAGLNVLSEYLNNFSEVLKIAGVKNKAVLKAAFLAQKAANVASIIANAYTAGAAVTAATANPAAGAAVTGAGLVNAGIVAALGIREGVRGGRQQGGPTSPNTLYDVTENGAPEMFVSGNKQYLMTGSKGGRVVSGGAMAANDSGGAPKVTVINNTGVQASATTQYISKNELRVILDAERVKTGREVERNIAAGIANNTGDVNNALNTSTQLARRLNR